MGEKERDRDRDRDIERERERVREREIGDNAVSKGAEGSSRSQREPLWRVWRRCRKVNVCLLGEG